MNLTNKHMITTSLMLGMLSGINTNAATIYAFDYDKGTSPSTESGFTSLLGGGAGDVQIDGIFFRSLSGGGDNHSDRGAPNALTRDFHQADGAEERLRLRVGEPRTGSPTALLAAGLWKVEIWSWDQTFPNHGLQLGGVIQRALNEDGDDVLGGTETILATGGVPDPLNPAVTFNFNSDGNSVYDIFIGEDPAEGGTRSRINAVRLTLVPEPGSLALLGIGGLLVARRRR